MRWRFSTDSRKQSLQHSYGNPYRIVRHCAVAADKSAGASIQLRRLGYIKQPEQRRRAGVNRAYFYECAFTYLHRQRNRFRGQLASDYFQYTYRRTACVDLLARIGLGHGQLGVHPRRPSGLAAAQQAS
jgi:hypothetical protein